MGYIIHDIAKILYTREGYLPDYPYHMISDKEMFDAFIYKPSNFFEDMYPNPEGPFDDIYQDIVAKIKYHIERYLLDSTYSVPVWVYSYMLNGVIGCNSDERDRRDYIALLGVTTSTAEFTSDIYLKTYHVSREVLKKLPSSIVAHRPATIFGEPDVVKQLKLYSAL